MHRLVAAIVVCAIATLVSAETYCVPEVAHLPGVGTSRWRTEVAILNLCPTDAVVGLRLHTDTEIFTETFTIDAGKLQVFPDVVTSLTTGDVAGALELRSNVGLSVTSRTYNLAKRTLHGRPSSAWLHCLSSSSTERRSTRPSSSSASNRDPGSKASSPSSLCRISRRDDTSWWSWHHRDDPTVTTPTRPRCGK